jgi:2-polyprenyl-3-methyl-5-hydroxy-6-metoxy-1,4-benzoquinol methylase
MPERPRVRVRCLLCKTAGTPTDIAENGFTLARCANCGLLFVSPRPRDEDILAIYEHDAAHTGMRQLIAKGRASHEVAHARHTLRLLRGHRAGGRLLEIGPGGGLFLDEARQAGYSIAGIEPNPQQAAFIDETFGIRCTTEPLGPETLKGELFDVIYHCNVLSHFPDPVQTLGLIRSRLRPGGILVMETGNYADVDRRFYRLIAATERFQLPDHLYFFGERSLRILLEQTGFALRKVYRYSRIPEKCGPSALRALRLGWTVKRAQFFLTYRMGRWFPKRGRPQTLIVVATPK